MLPSDGRIGKRPTVGPTSLGGDETRVPISGLETRSMRVGTSTGKLEWIVRDRTVTLSVYSSRRPEGRTSPTRSPCPDVWS